MVRAIVVAVNATGTNVGRTLTNDRGTFVLRLSAPGSVRLRILRIGFQPTEGPEVLVAAQGVERVRLVASGRTVSLAAMGVRERETCRVSADTGLLVARVWEEARTAMLTTQLSADEPAMFAEWIEYDRTLDSTGRVVRSQKVRTTRHPTTHAFRSVPAEVLREKGFVAQDEGSSTYYAPDAEVLLSNVFASGHCFHLADSPKGKAALIGVAFTPTRERRRMLEIEGTLWIDRASAELRTLEFKYLNLPDAASAAEPGGVVEFRRLPDARWFVSEWSVRMPQLVARPRRADNSFFRSIMPGVAILRAVQVTGGEVTRAQRGDSVVYRSLGPSIAVQLVAPDSLMSVAGAVVALDGTDYRDTVNSSGFLRMSPVLAGRYRATIRTPLMDRLGMPSVMRELVTRMDLGTDSVAMPRAKDVLERTCPADSIRDGEGMLMGRVLNMNARALPGVIVTATWKSNFSMVQTAGGASLAYGEKSVAALSDVAGFWRACGVPRDMPLNVAIATDSGTDKRVIRLEGRPFAMVDLVQHPPILVSSDIDLTLKRSVTTLVEIAVTDERGAPVPEAAIEVRAYRHPTRIVVTNTNGIALMPDVPVGRVVVMARRIGFKQGQITAVVENTERVRLPIQLSIARAPMLDTMRVVGVRQALARHDAFEARRQAGSATVSITREEIRKRNPVQVWEMLTNVPGVTVSDRDNQVVATSSRALIQNFQNGPCFLKVVVDGVMINRLQAPGTAGFDLRQLPHPDSIHGVEVFNGPASIPLEYGGARDETWCGLIAIWTR